MDLHYSLTKRMFIPDATSIDVLVEDTSSDDEVDTQVTVREPIFLITIKDCPYLFHDRGQHRKASVDSGSTNRVTSPLAATPREAKDLA